MGIVQHNVRVKASPLETTALVGDASRWPEWYPTVTEVKITAPFPEKGGKVDIKTKQAGMSSSITETVLDYQPGKLALLQIEGRMSGHERWEFTPDGDGTRVSVTLDYTLPGVIGKFADALIGKRMASKSLEDALHNLEALLER